MISRSILLAFWAVLLLQSATGQAAEEARPVSADLARLHSTSHWAPNVIVPQTRAFATTAQPQAVEITAIHASVDILEQAATTKLTLDLRNPTAQQLESEVLMPVPDGAVVRSFDFQGSAAEPTATLLDKDEARRIYDAIVAKVRDPALLEFAGYNLIRSSVFPVPANGNQRVQLVYEHLLPRDGNRVDYVLPRSESLAYGVPWNIKVQVRAKRPVSTIYSPSHAMEVERTQAGTVMARVSEAAVKDPGAFRLSYLLDGDGVTATLMAYPDPKTGGGYFLLLAGLPAKLPGEAEAEAIKREVTLVFDRSGSMRGEKIEQVREAALQVVHGLDEGEHFNVIAYNEAVEAFAPQPVAKNSENLAALGKYLKGIQARGGTNIHDALLESLRQKPAAERLPIVLFLTDGLPTIGQTAELAIRELATNSNPFKRRVFTFGVGVDVNTPLLERVADRTRATATFILPKEDVEAKVGQVFRRLAGPVLADPKLTVVTGEGGAAPGRTRDLLPARLPDLFDGDQLVLLGQYVGDEPLRFRLEGNYRGAQRSFSFDFPLDKATTRNAFVPRLWASRKIGVLIDAIRDMGAHGDPTRPHLDPAKDPRFKELVDDVVRLSKEFGILTEYTAFFAREGTDLSRQLEVFNQACQNFDSRAIQTRGGWSSLNQELNRMHQKGQVQLSYDNGYWNDKMERVTVSNVKQVNDKTFYCVEGKWVDAALVDQKDVKADRVVKFGTQEFEDLKQRMIEQGRQGSLSVGKDALIRDEQQKLNYQVDW